MKQNLLKTENYSHQLGQPPSKCLLGFATHMTIGMSVYYIFNLVFRDKHVIIAFYKRFPLIASNSRISKLRY